MADKLDSEFLRGSLDLVVLSALADGAKYGYLIQQKIVETSRAQVQLPAGTLYPLLHKLEAEKLVRCRWDDSTGRKRKWYELTTTGRKRLQERTRQWHLYADCLRELLAPVVTAKATTG